MKAMFASFVAIALIAMAAWFTLNQMNFTSQDVYSGPNVRLE